MSMYIRDYADRLFMLLLSALTPHKHKGVGLDYTGQENAAHRE